MKTILKIVSLVLALAVAGCAGLSNAVDNTVIPDINKGAVALGGVATSVGNVTATATTIAGDVVKVTAIVVTDTAETPKAAATTPTPAPAAPAATQ